VRADAIAVDPVDAFVRSGAYATPTPFPFVVGRDVVGTVAETGPGAVGFRVGDRVWCNSLGHGGRQGACAEYSVVPVDRLYHLPDGVDPVTAVAALHPAATATWRCSGTATCGRGRLFSWPAGPATLDARQPPSPWPPVPGCS
jgi:NADPH:quinone reductase-like Zn-dependent oxidoreductase